MGTLPFALFVVHGRLQQAPPAIDVVELSNGTLTNIQGQEATNPALTITVNRADLETVMMGKASFDDLIANGKARLNGDRRPYDLLKTSVARFDVGFEILPGTKARPESPQVGSFQQTAPPRTDGG